MGARRQLYRRQLQYAYVGEGRDSDRTTLCGWPSGNAKRDVCGMPLRLCVHFWRACCVYDTRNLLCRGRYSCASMSQLLTDAELRDTGVHAVLQHSVPAVHSVRKRHLHNYSLLCVREYRMRSVPSEFVVQRRRGDDVLGVRERHIHSKRVHGIGEHGVSSLPSEFVV